MQRSTLFRAVLFLNAFGYILLLIARFLTPALSQIGFMMISFTVLPLIFVSLYELLKVKQERVWAIIGLLLSLFSIAFIVMIFMALNKLQ